MVKNAANIITSLRVLFAIAMLAARPFSPLFWVCYLCAGLSDILDGIAARGLKQQSERGATLDSIADIIFACAIAAILITNFRIPAWLWIGMACIALVRITGYGIGYLKYHSFSALHTYANKATGAMLFLFPLFNRWMGLDGSGLLFCLLAFISALEELLITIRARQLDRERKGLFF